MDLDKYQKRLIGLLIDKYEKTATYRGESATRQTVSVAVDQVFPGYDEDSTPVADIDEFTKSMKHITAETPIYLRYKDRKLKNEIDSLAINADEVEPQLYDMAGRVPKRQIHLSQITSYDKYLGRGKISDRFIYDQTDLLRHDRNAWYDPDTASDVIRTVIYLEGNKSDLLYRELSIILFSDTKYMEKHGLFSKVLRVIKRFGELDFTEDDFDSEKEYEAAVFAEFMLYENPTYVNFNGNGQIRFYNATELLLKRGTPVAIRSDMIPEILELCVDDDAILTIENLTSYNRFTTDMFQIYLAGYHNHAKQELLMKINEKNLRKKWYHSGDIDPDGFMILENLRVKTGIDFVPYMMDAEYLTKYSSYTKRLNDNDRKKAAHHIAQGKYIEVLEQMLKSDSKLEQEIISLKI